MRMCAQTHGRAYVQPHTPTHTYVYTPMYTHVRTYTRTRRKFSDNKSALQHCQTEFHHHSNSIHFYYSIAVQSVSILAPHWLRHLYKLSLSVIICCTFPTIFQLFTNHSIISCSSPIHYHCFPSSRTVHPHIIYHFYLISIPTNSPFYQYVSIL